MNHFQQINEELEQRGLKRQLSALQLEAGAWCQMNGQRLYNMSSNDYLGLTFNAELQKDFAALLAEHPEYLQMGACSSRLLTGNYSLYDEVENLITCQYNAQSALFFNSGYHANVGLLPALADKQDLILSDKLCHASIIDGIRLSNADHVRYRHLDYAQLEQLLEKKRHQYRHVFIVSESVFSMDGDSADLKQLVALKEKFDVMLYIDEAHGVGVYGEHGLGLCEEQQVVNQIDILVAPLGKAFASVGAFVVFSKALKAYMVNKARTLIFTTALPPVNLAWTRLVAERMPGFKKEREALKQLCAKLANGLNELGYQNHVSHIQPVMIGENEAAIQLANHLRKEGFLVFAIRPPTVPANTARLRLSLTADMEMEQLNILVEQIRIFNIRK